MTLADLYPNDYQNPRLVGDSWLDNAPRQATDDDRAIGLQSQLSDMARKIGMRGRADDLQKKVNFLRAFQNRPVNLYDAPTDQNQARLQQMIGLDQGARQAGLDSASKWDDFRRTQNAKELQYRDLASQVPTNIANRGIGLRAAQRQESRDPYVWQRQLENDDYTKQARDLSLQSNRIGLEQANMQMDQKSFFNAVEAVQSGVPFQNVLPQLAGYPDSDKALVKAYADSYLQRLEMENRRISGRDRNRIEPNDPNDIRLAQSVADQYNEQDRAQRMMGKVDDYTEASQKALESEGYFDKFANFMGGAAPGLGIIGGLTHQPTPNYANTISQMTELGGKIPQQMLFERDPKDPAASFVRRGVNGWESLLAPPAPSGGNFAQDGKGNFIPSSVSELSEIRRSLGRGFSWIDPKGTRRTYP